MNCKQEQRHHNIPGDSFDRASALVRAAVLGALENVLLGLVKSSSCQLQGG